jgi:hypothetical protein
LPLGTSRDASGLSRDGGPPARGPGAGGPFGVRRVGLALLAALALGLAVATATACGEEPEQETAPTATSAATSPAPSLSPSPSPSATEPSATPQISWDWIRTREYRDWVNAPGWEERRTTDSPHSEAKVVFIDPATAATIGSGETRFPAGATIVKEGYDAGGDLVIVAAMQRRPDEGWFFAEYGSDGSVIEEGDDPPLCTRCHRGAGDGVLAFSLE